MSFSVEMSSGEEVRKKPCEQQEPEPLSQSQELLTKMKEYLEKRIDRELLNVKKNSRENRRGKTFERKLTDALFNSLINIHVCEVKVVSVRS